MSTSGTVTYSQTRDGIIQEALELLGYLADGATPSANDLTTCSTTLNMMIKSWVAEGAKLWKISQASLTLAASQESYTLGTGGDLVIPKPIEIIDARLVDSSSNETELIPVSRSEYMMLSDKGSTGNPTQYYFQPLRTTSKLFIWPVADATIAAAYTIKISYYSQLEDFSAAANEPDLPIEWAECLATNLAVRVAPKFGKNLAEIPSVVQLAVELKAMLFAFDQENTSVYFGVDSE